MHVSMKVSVFRRGSYVARIIACAELLGVAQPRIHGHNPSVAYEFTDPLVARALTCILPTLVPLLLSTHRQLDQCNRR